MFASPWRHSVTNGILDCWLSTQMSRKYCWMQLRAHSRADRVKALYERFCQRAARLGVRRDPWEGPSDFSKRAALLLPNESERIRQISNSYIALRYAPEPAAIVLDKFAKEVSAFAGR